MVEWPVRLRFGGLGGQGLVTLGAVLATAGARSGLQVAASQAYGSRARGGATRADVILSDEEIDFPHVHQADLLVVLAQEAYELYAPGVSPESVVMYDDFFVEPATGVPARQLAVPGTRTAIDRVGNKVSANFVMLGALTGYTRLMELDPLVQALDEMVRERFREVNRKALELGHELGRALRQGKEP